MALYKDETFTWSRPASRFRITDLVTGGFDGLPSEGELSWLPAPIGRPGDMSPLMDLSGRRWAGRGRVIPRVVEGQCERFDLDHKHRLIALQRCIELGLDTEVGRADSGMTGRERPDVVAFANEFGLLGLPMGHDPLARPDTPEALDVWLYCARELRIFREIARVAMGSPFEHVKLKRLRSEDTIVVDVGDGHVAEWREADAVGATVSAHANGYVLPVPRGVGPESVRDDPSGAVMQALQVHLRLWLDPLVSWKLDYSEWLPADTPRFMEVSLEPSSLLGALWLTVADEVSESVVAERLCPGCHEPFNVFAVSAVERGRKPRSDLTYCSDRCRKRYARAGGPVRAYRSKQ